MRTEDFGAELKRLGFSDFAGVPCSYLAPLINWAINENAFIMANNEGEAVAIASGISLVGNSSLGNHCVDLQNFETSQTASLVSAPKFCKNSTSTTANTRIVLNAESRNDSSLRGESQDSPKQSKTTSDCAEVSLDNFVGFQARNCEIELEVHRAVECAESRESAKETNAQKFGVVLMQNSGLSNALSPLTSLNHTFNIPILGFVSLRGEPNESGVNTDEPQHELLGKITDKLLQTCEVECAFLDSNLEVACEQLSHAKAVLKSNKSFFFIVRNHCFEKVALTNSPILCHIERSEISQNKRDSSPTAQNDKIRHDAKPTRLQALQIIQNLGQNCALLATTGKAGRELYELGDKENQLYMVGSMGCVSALGLGIALKSHKKVIAIDGDSALLMRLGTLAGNAYYAKITNKGNFCHILLDNQSHDSTGGQFNLSPFVDFVAIAKSCGYEVAKRAQNLDEFSAILGEFLDAQNGGAYFIYLDIAKGSKKDLGRPKITPKQVAQRFGAWLNNKEV
ncbi:thiamine pyrophosphate-dependent enzyme [Helicobacter sp. 23-1044]